MLDHKSYLITGGTGSFGHAFASELLENYNPKKIVIFSRDEFKQDVMQKQFKSKYPETYNKLRFFIGDVRDKERLIRAFDGIDYVIHAAAMKQVIACEYNPFEAIKTNIHGAQNIIDAALDTNIQKVIALSTDKAVNPINLYGGTKLVSDKLFISANAYKGDKCTSFSVVRYGNVSGSRGSVIPYFHDLINQGAKSLPITDVRMTRFWMTLDDAVKLVLLALTESNGGETYVFKNPSYRIIDLAEALNSNLSIEYVGIREGEKLHESMITADDSRMTYDFDSHYIIYPNYIWWNEKDYIKPGGKPVNDGWEYNSGTNDRWLSVEELRSRLKLI